MVPSEAQHTGRRSARTRVLPLDGCIIAARDDHRAMMLCAVQSHVSGEHSESRGTMAPEQVQAALDDYFTRLNSMDPDRLMGAFAADAQGNAERRALYEELVTIYRDLTFVREDVYIVGNQVAMKWYATGTTHQGTTVAFDGIDTLAFNDSGKLEHQMSYWDPEKLVAQLEG
jgi:hypothetical protein